MEKRKMEKVKITYKNEKINPVDFGEYSDFEFRWVETILTKVIGRNDMLCLLKKFGIRFFEENWEENLPIAEMGNVLISDIPKKDLVPAVKNIFKERYPNKTPFSEARKLWESLENLNIDKIRAKYFKISKGQKDLSHAKNKSAVLSLILNFIYKEGGDKIL